MFLLYGLEICKMKDRRKQGENDIYWVGGETPLVGQQGPGVKSSSNKDKLTRKLRKLFKCFLLGRKLLFYAQLVFDLN